MPRHILYVFHGRFPDPRAAALFAAEEARSLATHCKVTIVVPTRDTTDIAAARTQYALSDSIDIIALPTLDIYRFPIIRRFSFEVSLFSFSQALRKFLRNSGGDIDWVFCFDQALVVVAKDSGKKVLFEIHDFPQRNLVWTEALKKADKILATNAWKEKELVKQFGVDSQKIFLERNGVSIETFSNTLSKQDARTHLELPLEGSMVVYTGNLYEWKGVNTLAEAARKMPEITVYFVGGTDIDLERFYSLYGSIPNIRLVGQRPHSEMPYWQAAADALILPNTARMSISEHYTSPLKLFEYMVSNKPIIASALPSINEIVDDSMAYTFAADDASALAETVLAVLADTAGAERRAANARKHVEQFSWAKRAARVLAQLN